MDDILIQLVKSNQSYSKFDKKTRYVIGSVRYDNFISNSIKHDSKWESMFDWQTKWNLKFKNGLTFYFDNNELISKNNNLKNVNNLKIVSLKKKILKNGGKIEPIITSLSNKRKNLDNFIMISNSKNCIIENKDLKIWDLDKLTRFFQIYETNLNQLDNQNIKNKTLSKDIIYFNDSPHIYLFDLKQRYKPLICKKWDIGLVNKSKREQLPYPHLQKDSTYGKCPFKPIKLKHDSNILIPMIDSNLAKKRYSRDLINQRYALKLRKIYSKHAKPPLNLKNLITDLDLQESTNQFLYDLFNHNCENSKKLVNKFKFLKLKRFNTMDVNFKSFNENLDPLESLRNDLVKQKNDSDTDNSSDNDNDNDEDNDSLGSNDTVETLALSELSDDHEPRTSLMNLNLNASIYDEQNDEIVVNTGFRSINKPIELRNAKIEYCENCHQIYNDTLNNHINTDSHKLYSMNEGQFSEIDKLIDIIRA